jgi:hypothetical protein
MRSTPYFWKLAEWILLLIQNESACFFIVCRVGGTCKVKSFVIEDNYCDDTVMTYWKKVHSYILFFIYVVVVCTS